jgi:hypothetical protein
MDATGPTSPDDTLLAEPNIGPEKVGSVAETPMNQVCDWK